MSYLYRPEQREFVTNSTVCCKTSPKQTQVKRRAEPNPNPQKNHFSPKIKSNQIKKLQITPKARNQHKLVCVE